MVRAGLTVAALVALTACSDGQRPDIPTQTGLPPVGLAATAVWLEERQVALPRQVAARDIPTSQIRATVSGQAPVAATPAAQPAVALSSQPVPTETVALAARAFADACVASLPSMQNVRAQARDVSKRYFGVTPQESSRSLLTGQPRGGDISLSVFEQAGRGRDINQCSVGARRQGASAMAQALVNTMAAAGYSLTPVQDDKAKRAWRIEGTPPGTILRVNSRKNFLGQVVTGAWITWQ